MICRQCGATIDDDSIFCSHCGARQDVAGAGGEAAPCELSPFLTRAGGRFQLKTGGRNIVYFAYVFPVFMVVMAFFLLWIAFSALTGTEDLGGLEYVIALILFALAGFCVWFTIPIFRTLALLRRLPPGSKVLEFSADDVLELVVNRSWYCMYQLDAVIRLGDRVMELPLGIPPRFSPTRGAAEEQVRKLSSFFGRQLPVRWVDLSRLSGLRGARGSANR